MLLVAYYMATFDYSILFNNISENAKLLVVFINGGKVMRILKLPILFLVHFLVSNECFGEEDGPSSSISTEETTKFSHSLDSLEYESEGKYLTLYTTAQSILYNVILYRR